MANSLTFDQIATVLNSILVQANGTASLVVTDTSSFVAGGSEALKCGYDVLNTAASQVLSKTIFANRPYSAKFKGLDWTPQQFGNMMRKLSVIDKAFENDPAIDPLQMVDGGSIDPFVINTVNVQQENFVGSSVYKKAITVYDWQWDQSMTDVNALGSFISMIMQNATDMLEQARENLKRMTIVNFIAAVIGNYPNQNYKLVTAYNTYIGASPALTWADICADATEYQRFMRFAYARIAAVSSMLTERSGLFHVSMPGKTIMRHTPYEYQQIYMLAQEKFGMEAQVLADAYHDNYLKYTNVETVNFWQSIDTPDEINVTPSYLATTGGNAGEVIQGAAVNTAGIFAVLMDRDACGVIQRNERVKTQPNMRADYNNWWFSAVHQYINSFTENFVVFTLD